MDFNQKLSNIYLVAKIGAIHNQLLPHFLEYYLHNIGIPPENCIITVQDNNSDALEVTLKHLSKYNITPFEIWKGKFTPVGVMYHFLRMLVSVPSDAWVVPADIDEFNFKDNSLMSLVSECEQNNYDYVSSIVIDMVSKQGIVELKESPLIWKQFSHESKLTNYIGLGQSKMILMRPHVLPQTGGFHGPSYSLARYYRVHPTQQKTYHFKWHGDVLSQMKSYNNSVNERIYVYLKNGGNLIVTRKPLLYYPDVFTTLFKTFWNLAFASFRRMVGKD